MKKQVPYFIAGLLPILLLVPVQLNVQPSMLLAERFFPGFGWLEIAFAEIYSIFLLRFILKNKLSKIRLFYWGGFSFIFFFQFALGMLIDQRFLMSGSLHLPIPALIIAEPIFRGGHFFMPILVASTILISGPAWCSHFCYMGAIDNLLSKNKKPKPIKRKTSFWVGYSILILVITLAISLKISGISNNSVFYISLLFGIVGVLVMFFISRKLNYMFHCTVYCPVGRIVALVSKLYPARLKINKSSCTLCNRCTSYCKYDALSITDIKKGTAGWNCTLCGDCVESCHANSIRISFFNSSADAFKYYMAVVVGIHVVFLALARL